MSASFDIREESPLDFDAIGKVTIAAFSGSEFGHNGEAGLIKTLRAGSGNSLSLVACDAEQIVGHIMFTPATIEVGGTTISGMGLAPMSVLPEFQGKGIGSSLVTEGMSRLWSEECEFIVVLGHPEYYPKFGFQLADRWSITHGFEGIPQSAFFIRGRSESSLGKLEHGKAYFGAEFGPQHQSSREA